MFLAQLVAAMLFWGATVAVLARRREDVMNSMRARSRGERTVQAIVRLVVSIALLGFGMWALSQGGLDGKSFSLWGWVLTTVVGSIFIYLQTTALAPLVLNAVTPSGGKSSDKEDADHP